MPAKHTLYIYGPKAPDYPQNIGFELPSNHPWLEIALVNISYTGIVLEPISVKPPYDLPDLIATIGEEHAIL